MANVALAAPTSSVTNSPGSTGLGIVALPAAEATSLATFTGFSFPNNGAVLVRATIGAAGTGTFNFIINKALVLGNSLASLTTFQVTVANSTVYVWGPFPPSIFNDANGLVQCNVSVVTGNAVGVYSLPGAVT